MNEYIEDSLQIDETLFIGDGNERNCYLHPERPDRCIKISKPGHGRKQHRHDISLYTKLAQYPDIWKHVARFLGPIPTNQGEALLFETVRDFDGKVSKSLLDFLREDQSAIDEKMLDALNRFGRFILRHRIILKDPSPSNLLYRRDSESRGEFVVIDGIGFFWPKPGPLAPLLERKVRRQWEKVITRLRKEAADNPKLLAKIDKYWNRQAS